MECFQRCTQSCLSVCRGGKKKTTPPTHPPTPPTVSRQISEPQAQVTQFPLEAAVDFLGKKKFRVHCLPESVSWDYRAEQPSKPHREEPDWTLPIEDQATKADRRTPLKDTLLNPIYSGRHLSIDRPGNDYTVKYRPDRFDTTETLKATDPTLEFCTAYDFSKRVLCVRLQKANALPARGEKAMRDVFVSMYIVPEREEIHESQVVKQTLNPVFNETFELHGIVAPEEAREKALVFKIYDNSSIWKNELIGMVNFPLHLANFEGICVKRKVDVRAELLKVMCRGDLLLSLRYNHHEKKLSGILHKATNLYNPHLFHTISPYVMVDLMHQHSRVSRWKSRVQRKTKFPVFNEMFEFYFDFEVDKVMLRFTVLDAKKIHWKETLGVSVICQYAPENDGREHWAKMLGSGGQTVCHWHRLTPPKKEPKHRRRSSL